MVFADWTYSGAGSAALDTSTKYAGNSSARLILSSIAGIGYLIHDTFLEPQATIIMWTRKDEYGHSWASVPSITLSGYGTINLDSYMATATWTKLKIRFWYDVGSNTKWGRVEKWISSAWAQQGGDINFGSGSPAASTLTFGLYSSASAYNKEAWFDEVEVSA